MITYVTNSTKIYNRLKKEKKRSSKIIVEETLKLKYERQFHGKILP